ncbi:MAG: ExbD/TolR family protein [Planctomycetota bacterium]
MSEELPPIPIAPLIDCVLQLFTFVFITSSFVTESYFEVNLPEGFNQEASFNPKILKIYLLKNKRIKINDKIMFFKEVEKYILENIKEQVEKVEIYPDKNVRAQFLVDVIELLQHLQIKNIEVRTIRRY